MLSYLSRYCVFIPALINQPPYAIALNDAVEVAENASLNTFVGWVDVSDDDDTTMQSIVCSNDKFTVGTITNKRAPLLLSAVGVGDIEYGVNETMTFTATDMSGNQYTSGTKTVVIAEAGTDTYVESLIWRGMEDDDSENRWIASGFAPVKSVVPSTKVAVGKIGSTELITQMDQVRTFNDNSVDTCALHFYTPSGNLVTGDTEIEVFTRDGTRDNTDRRTPSEVGALGIEVVVSDMEDWNGDTIDSGVAAAKVEDYVEAGDKYLTIYEAGRVKSHYCVRVPFVDTTSSVENPTLFAMFSIDLFNDPSDDSLAWFRFRVTLRDGARVVSNPSHATGKQFKIDVKIGGVVVWGHSNGDVVASDVWQPYYMGSPLALANGSHFCSDVSKNAKGHVVHDVETLIDRGVLPAIKLTRFGSSADILTKQTDYWSTTCSTSGGDQGGIDLPLDLRPFDFNPGHFAVRLVGGTPPTGAALNVPYAARRPTATTHHTLFPRQQDAAANSNHAIPPSGGISGGSGLKVAIACTPWSCGSVGKGWASTAERSELGLVSGVAARHIRSQSRATLEHLRCNVLAYWRVGQVHYVNQSTLRIADFITNSATYAGLGTGTRTATYYSNGRVDFALPVGAGFYGTNTTGRDGNPATTYTAVDALTGRQDSFEHTPSPEWQWLWLWEPEPHHHELAISYAAGIMMSNARGSSYGSKTYNGATTYASCALWNNSPRSDARGSQAGMVGVRRLPDSVRAGTFSERALFDAVETSNVAVLAGYITEMASSAPNAHAAGLLQNRFDSGSASSSYQNWQAGQRADAYGFLAGRGDVADWSPWIVFNKKNALGAAGIDPPGEHSTYQMGSYYQTYGGYAGVLPNDINSLGWAGIGTDLGVPVVDASTNRITVTTANKPTNTGGVFYAADDVVILRASGAGAACSNLSIDTVYYLRPVSQTPSGNSLIMVFELSTTPGGGAFDMVGTTVTNCIATIHPKTYPASGTPHYNPMYFMQHSLLVYAAQRLKPADADCIAAVDAVEARIAQLGGPSTEAVWYSDLAKYARQRKAA